MNIHFMDEKQRILASLKSPAPEGGDVHVPRVGEQVVITKSSYIVTMVCSYYKTAFTTEPPVYITLRKVQEGK